MKKIFTSLSLLVLATLASSITQAPAQASTQVSGDAGDGLVSSNVTLYKSTTWSIPIYYFVVRQAAHADIHYCAKGSAFSGNAADATQLTAFFNASCPNHYVVGSYSQPKGTGYTTKTYLPGITGNAGSMVITNSYSQSDDQQVTTQAGFQTYAFDLDPGVNPVSSVIMEQGASIKYQGSENPTLNSYKQTFVYQGSYTDNLAPITN